MNAFDDQASPRLHPLTFDVLPSALQLSRQAGWNQTLDDWIRLVFWQRDGCFWLELDGRLVATITTTIYGRSLAWIGMVLVDEAFRRRGFARRLMQHALAWLDAKGIETVALDATPTGKLLYDTLGFRDLHAVDRWQGTAQGGQPLAPAERQPALGALQVADVHLDRRAFGANRHKVLRLLTRTARSPGHVMRQGEELAGYVLTRPGASHRFIGPLVARHPDQAAALLDAALASFPGEAVFIDVPRPNAAARKLAASLDFTVARSFMRMARGTPPNADLSLVYGTAGPEIG